MSNVSCPRCKASATKSVAAMNYSETRRWERDGQFSGSGVGIGTGGLGVGFGGGSYHERGEEQSKRADVFEEPTAQAPFPVASLLVGGLFGGGLLINYTSFAGFFIDAVGGSSSSAATEGTFAAFSGHTTSAISEMISSPLVIGLCVVGGMAFIAMQWIAAGKNNQKNEQWLQKEYPALLDRYNELRYCETCHTLFDATGEARDASPLGFNALMTMPATNITRRN